MTECSQESFAFTAHFSRRVVAKAEFLDKGENPRFAVTSLTPEQWPARQLYEKFYCARGEMSSSTEKCPDITV
jgi:hypothetical protein